MGSQFTGNQAQPQLEAILHIIGELVEVARESNSEIMQECAVGLDGTLLRTRQSELLKEFKGTMLAVQNMASKAVYEVETNLGSLENLPGVNSESEINRLLGCTLLGRRPSYKIRDSMSGIPSPELATYDEAISMSSSNFGRPIVALQPTLRNVWVIQHAYTKLLNYKETLIQRYLAAADQSAVASRRISREYYEDLGLGKLPSKNKLGNLLDVKYSSYNHATHDLQIVLVFKEQDGTLKYVEAVKGDQVDVGSGEEHSQYLILPVTEASIKNLYDAYRSLRKATSEQRRATKDKEFAAKLPVDEMDELQRQFSSAQSGLLDEVNISNTRKRRRMAGDEGEEGEDTN
ncbi:hypothetical protein F5Y11DRAFT_315581 [Daldinia sp. FL1419]|nr:hypothetical protein F5Y11DRAFT_315581 [Daldinia sp. FL1419]